MGGHTGTIERTINICRKQSWMPVQIEVPPPCMNTRMEHDCIGFSALACRCPERTPPFPPLVLS
eukprot:scaffold219432_cov13-Tisochrysis_lutea.AAC.1